LLVVSAQKDHAAVMSPKQALYLAATLALATAPAPSFAMSWPAAPAASTIETVADARHADPELEALLPTTLGGVVLTVESQSGADLATRSDAFDTFLKSLGKTRADFTVASAYATGGLRAEIGAWRVKGGDPALLLQGFKTALQSSSATPLTQAEATIGGQTVTRIGDPGQLTHGPLYVVGRGDTLLFVQTPDPALADEAMAKLTR
jgi:hypothetical protein